MFNVEKVASGFILVLFLCFILDSSFRNGNEAEKRDNYIRADGRIDGTDNIQRVGNVYKFKEA